MNWRIKSMSGAGIPANALLWDDGIANPFIYDATASNYLIWA